MAEQETLQENKKLLLENAKLRQRLDELQLKYNKLWTLVFAMAAHKTDIDETFKELIEWYEEELR